METKRNTPDRNGGQRLLLLWTIPILGFSQHPAYPQVLLGSPHPYSENFNSLGFSGVQAWNNNATLPGWYANVGIAPASSYTASSGNVPAARVYSYGQDSFDRALGLQTSPQTSTASIGVRFRNDSGETLHDFHVSYQGEQWRNASISGQTLVASYRTSFSPIDGPGTGVPTDWSLLPVMNFENPARLGLSFDLPRAVDGTSLAYQKHFVQVPLAGLSLAPGQELFIRWELEHGSGLSHGLAVDDFQLTWIPEPSSLFLFGAGVVFLFTRRTGPTKTSSTPISS